MLNIKKGPIPGWIVVTLIPDEAVSRRKPCDKASTKNLLPE